MSSAESREKWLTVIVLSVIAMVARLWDAEFALDHFDEGVYALSGRVFLEDGGFYIGQEFHAPPLLAYLIAASYTLLGLSDVAACLPSLLFGTLTVPLLYLFIRPLGRPPALGAALGVAVSGFHIEYSRMALTDAPLAALLVASLYALNRTLESGSKKWAVISGVAVGAAWLVKYNGFVSLLIVGAAWLMHRWRSQNRDNLKCDLVLLAIAAGIALVCYIPWYLHVGTKLDGGYGELVRHHRGYSLGLSGYFDRIATYWRLIGVDRICFVFGIPIAVIMLIHRASTLPHRTAGVWLLWWVLTVPLYTVYPRLLLAGDVAAVAIFFGTVFKRMPTAQAARSLFFAGAVVLFGVWIFAGGLPDGGGEGPYRKFAELVDQATPDDAVVMIVGQPPMVFYMPRQPVIPPPDSDILKHARTLAAERPTYLAIDWIAKPDLVEQLSAAADVEQIGQATSLPSAPTQQNYPGLTRSEWTVRLYRVVAFE